MLFIQSNTQGAASLCPGLCNYKPFRLFSFGPPTFGSGYSSSQSSHILSPFFPNFLNRQTVLPKCFPNAPISGSIFLCPHQISVPLHSEKQSSPFLESIYCQDDCGGHWDGLFRRKLAPVSFGYYKSLNNNRYGNSKTNSSRS